MEREGTRAHCSAWLARQAPFLAAAGVAVVLSLPGFWFPYLFDDFDFLDRVQTFHASILAPDPGSIFYRPISRELYFGLLNGLFPGGALAGHIINACLFVAAVLLGAILTSRLAGRRAGIITGLLLAAFGGWPVLVAWVSGAQDLIAIVLILLALHLELSGKGALSLIALACAILSKETAVAAAPALMAARYLRRSSIRDTVLTSARVAVLVVAWGLIHPGIRLLLAQGGTSRPGSYIGLDNPDRWGALVRSVLTLLNLPCTGFRTPWPKDLTWAVALAMVPFVAVLWTLRGSECDLSARTSSRRVLPRWQLVGFGILLAVPPLLLTCLIVQHWVPYYMCFSALGVSIAVAPWIATMPYARVAGILSLYLVLGVWSRGVELKPGMTTETGFASAAKALPRLEENFKRVARWLPPSALAYVSTMATGSQSVYIHVHRFQVLRVWYRNPTLQTLRPELRITSNRPEFLFGIDPMLNVFRIDVQTLVAYTSDGPIEYRRYRTVLTSYAIGLAGAGEIDRAVNVLVEISEPGTQDHVVDCRIAAMLLISRGRNAAAIQLLRKLPDLPLSTAFECVGMMLTVPTRGMHLEVPALEAFGFSPKDPKIIRLLMRALVGLGYNEVSARLAQRLLAVIPGDPEASQALARIRSIKGPPDRITSPVRALQLPEN